MHGADAGELDSIGGGVTATPRHGHGTGICRKDHLGVGAPIVIHVAVVRGGVGLRQPITLRCRHGTVGNHVGVHPAQQHPILIRIGPGHEFAEVERDASSEIRRGDAAPEHDQDDLAVQLYAGQIQVFGIGAEAHGRVQQGADRANRGAEHHEASKLIGGGRQDGQPVRLLLGQRGRASVGTRWHIRDAGHRQAVGLAEIVSDGLLADFQGELLSRRLGRRPCAQQNGEGESQGAACRR